MSHPLAAASAASPASASASASVSAAAAAPSASPPTRAVASPSSSSPSPPAPLAGSSDYSSDGDDDAAGDLRRTHDPFSRTHAITAAAGSIPAPNPKSVFPTRTAAFWSTLQSESGVIDESIVRRYVFDYGSVEQPAGGRALLWKLLLGYLPWDRREWKESLAKSRATYAAFVSELTNNPFADMEAAGDPLTTAAPSGSSSVRPLVKVKLGAMDDPLSNASAATPSTASVWSKYYADNGIREEIEKDVRRTYSTFHFFQERVKPMETTPEEIKAANAAERAKNAAAAAQQAAEDRRRGGGGGGGGSGNLFGNSSGSNLFDETSLRQSTAAKDTSVVAVPKVECVSTSSKRSADEKHHDVILRILFVYAKLNPGIRYVQGMNEILAPLYYVFAHSATQLRRFNPEAPDAVDPLEESARGLFGVETAEADAFFCFTLVMSHMKDRFIKSLDLSPTGVLNVIANLNLLLQRVDVQLWAHLNEIQVDPRFYSFRWLTLILSQEFELPDVLRLWDSLFAAEPEASMESTDATAASAAGASRKASSPSRDDSTNKKLIVEFLNDCCCAILCIIRRQLLDADFSTALKLLQSAGAGIDVQRVLFKAQEIQKMRRSGGGYIKESAKPAHTPLNPKDLATPFTVPVARPGDEPAPAKKKLHIALLDALRGKNKKKTTSAATADKPMMDAPLSPSPHSSPSPSPPSDEADDSPEPAAAAAAPAPSSAAAAALHSALDVAGSGAAALASGVSTLLASGVSEVAHIAAVVQDAISTQQEVQPEETEQSNQGTPAPEHEAMEQTNKQQDN